MFVTGASESICVWGGTFFVVVPPLKEGVKLVKTEEGFKLVKTEEGFKFVKTCNVLP